MQDLSTAVPGLDSRTRRVPITVVVATARPSLERAPAQLESALRVTDDCNRDGDRDVTVRAVPSLAVSAPTALLERLPDADCLVLEQAGTASADVVAILERVRRRHPSLPVLVVVDTVTGEGTGDDHRTITDAVRSHRLTECVRAGDALATDIDPDADSGCDRDRNPDRQRLARRIRAAVDRRRLAALSTRLLASLERSRDAIAVAGPDGRLEVANCWFAAQFGYERETLLGSSWRNYFTDDAVAHLESTAIPTAADGWRWTGTCTGRCQSGESISVWLRLAGLEDGSLVFHVEDVDGEGGDETGENDTIQERVDTDDTRGKE